MTTPLADRTADVSAGPARLLVLPTSVRDVVAFRGSFSTGPDLSTGDDVLQSLVADLLDKGTARQDRFAFAEALDDRGAQVSFYSDGLRVGFGGRVLRDDLDDVLGLVAEAVRQPALDPDEVQKAVTRAVAGVRRAREQTASQASGALARHLYGLAHPNYVLDPDDEIRALEAVTPEALRAYHAEHFGADAFTVVLVGDVEAEGGEAAVARAFSGWRTHGRPPAFDAAADPQPPARVAVDMEDRPNLDVRLGHPVSLRRDSDDFVATYAGVFALGGNFSSRLMQTVRDEQGLTYGIGAGLAGVAVEHDAHMRVTVGLSRENLTRGVEAVRAEIARFVEEGVGDAALGATQTTLAGQHVVALATTGGLAARLLVNAERGFDVGYLDRYPDLVRSLTEPDVTAAVRRHVRPSDLHEAVAGTLPG